MNCTNIKKDCQQVFLLYTALKKGMGYDNIFKGYFGGIMKLLAAGRKKALYRKTGEAVKGRDRCTCW